jgi:hypothetical protein
LHFPYVNSWARPRAGLTLLTTADACRLETIGGLPVASILIHALAQAAAPPRGTRSARGGEVMCGQIEGCKVAAADELRRDLVEKLQSHHEEIIAVVRRRSEAELRRPPVPGEWSALQQLEHLLLADEIWTGMALRAATEHEPDLAELWAQYRVVEETNPFPPPGDPRTLDELVAALQGRHRQTLAIVDATPLDGLSRVGRNTGWGDLTVIQMLRGVYRHYRMHIDQIEEREQSFTPRRVE